MLEDFGFVGFKFVLDADVGDPGDEALAGLFDAGVFGIFLFQEAAGSDGGEGEGAAGDAIGGGGWRAVGIGKGSAFGNCALRSRSDGDTFINLGHGGGGVGIFGTREDAGLGVAERGGREDDAVEMFDDGEEELPVVVGEVVDVEIGLGDGEEGEGKLEGGNEENDAGGAFIFGEAGEVALHAAHLVGPVRAGVVGLGVAEGEGGVFFQEAAFAGDGDGGPVVFGAFDFEGGVEGAEESEDPLGVDFVGVDDEGFGGHCWAPGEGRRVW